MFRPGNRAGVFIWENFHPSYRDLGRKNRDLGNRASPASHINTFDIFTKKRVARRDLRNPASLVDRAHMKRPLHEPSNRAASVTRTNSVVCSRGK